jgi:hypothetical protein
MALVYAGAEAKGDPTNPGGVDDAVDGFNSEDIHVTACVLDAYITVRFGGVLRCFGPRLGSGGACR